MRVEIVADESQRMKLKAMDGKLAPSEQIVAGPSGNPLFGNNSTGRPRRPSRRPDGQTPFL